MHIIDKIDRRIVRILLSDGSSSLKKMASEAHISLQRAAYRLEKLENNGVILGYYAIIDFSKLGLSAFRLMFRLSSARLSEKENFVKLLASNPNALWAAECAGKWDFLVDFLARDVFELSDILSQIEKRAEGTDVLFDFLLIRQVFDWSERNFPAKEKFDGILSGIPEKISEKDKAVLECIALNPRFSLKEISLKAEIDARTAKSRIDFLKKRGFLHSIKAHVNVQTFGLEKFKLLLKFQNSLESNEEIINFLKASKEVIGTIEAFGLWDLEAEICVKSIEVAKELLYSLRKKFPQQIKDFEILPILKEFPYHFLPFSTKAGV